MSVLPDTSVWIEHIRSPLPTLNSLIAARDVVMHSAVVGELAVGNLPNRPLFLSSLSMLPAVFEPVSQDVVTFIDKHQLCGRGLSWVDAQILVAMVMSSHQVWTLDKRLDAAAMSLGVAWSP